MIPTAKQEREELFNVSSVIAKRLYCPLIWSICWFCFQTRNFHQKMRLQKSCDEHKSGCSHKWHFPHLFVPMRSWQLHSDTSAISAINDHCVFALSSSWSAEYFHKVRLAFSISISLVQMAKVASAMGRNRNGKNGLRFDVYFLFQYYYC